MPAPSADEDESECGDCGIPRRRAKAARVFLDDLLKFIFPVHLQHPLSSGRLIVFGYYGPPVNGQLHSGQRGEHVVGDWELDSMCTTIDREDVLQVYVSDDRPLCELLAAQQEEIIAQSTVTFPQITREQVIALFEGVPRGTDNAFSFHDVQKVVVAYRDRRVADGKIMYPSLAAHSKSPPRKRAQSTEKGTATAAQRQSPISRGHKFKFSPDVAPATMFLKDKGLGDMEMATQRPLHSIQTINEVLLLTCMVQINKLLSTKAFKISSIEDGNNPSLTGNVRLIREDTTHQPQGGAQWDETCCYSLSSKHK
ncbi:putative aspartyl protease family A01A [Tribonema minus]|uniref:Putative aspartyl protease family A01A n=1 Tax=Tribonema minus TaxID=303371 RepID=A0A835ZGK5_9STRA|nr:putative aspartyl protease family A01A [Tribonema minus]